MLTRSQERQGRASSLSSVDSPSAPSPPSPSDTRPAPSASAPPRPADQDATMRHSPPLSISVPPASTRPHAVLELATPSTALLPSSSIFHSDNLTTLTPTYGASGSTSTLAGVEARAEGGEVGRVHPITPVSPYTFPPRDEHGQLSPKKRGRVEDDAIEQSTLGDDAGPSDLPPSSAAGPRRLSTRRRSTLVSYQDEASDVDIKGSKDVVRRTGSRSFVVKLFELLHNPAYAHLASFTEDGEQFVIHDPAAFASEVCPTVYRHSNFSSFTRQLNMYAFHKVSKYRSSDEVPVTFYHENFRRGDLKAAKAIRRDATLPASPTSPGSSGRRSSGSESTKSTKRRRTTGEPSSPVLPSSPVEVGAPVKEASPSHPPPIAPSQSVSTTSSTPVIATNSSFPQDGEQAAYFPLAAPPTSALAFPTEQTTHSPPVDYLSHSIAPETAPLVLPTPVPTSTTSAHQSIQNGNVVPPPLHIGSVVPPISAQGIMTLRSERDQLLTLTRQMHADLSTFARQLNEMTRRASMAQFCATKLASVVKQQYGGTITDFPVALYDPRFDDPSVPLSALGSPVPRRSVAPSTLLSHSFRPYPSTSVDERLPNPPPPSSGIPHPHAHTHYTSSHSQPRVAPSAPSQVSTFDGYGPPQPAPEVLPHRAWETVVPEPYALAASSLQSFAGTNPSSVESSPRLQQGRLAQRSFDGYGGDVGGYRVDERRQQY